MTTARVFMPEDVARARWAISPLWETVASIRVVRDGGSELHEAWARPTRELLRSERANFEVLGALVPPTGHLADFLTPTPRRRVNAFGTELDEIGAVPNEIVRTDLELLQEANPTSPVLARGIADPALIKQTACRELERYWELTVSRVWDRLRGLAEADLTWRLDQIAQGGTSQVFSTLHPRVAPDGARLVVDNTCTDAQTVHGAGLVLVPCAFAWPDLLVFNVDGYPPTITYAPRGVGNLWREADVAEDHPLVALLGRTRAAALILLDLPMTTAQLACHLDITPPTANEHLKVMLRSRLVDADRRGRSVLYRRTGLGDQLAAG